MRRFGLFVVLAAAGGGGGPKLPSTFLAAGKLTLDGQPVGRAEIWLVPKTPEVLNAEMTIRPYAQTAADGTFTLTTYLSGDEAPAGEYTAMVVKAGGDGPTDDGDADPAPAKGGKGKRVGLPAKYRTPQLAGLAVTVTTGPNQIDLDLKSR